jgi:hypothetical protein
MQVSPARPRNDCEMSKPSASGVSGLDGGGGGGGGGGDSAEGIWLSMLTSVHLVAERLLQAGELRFSELNARLGVGLVARVLLEAARRPSPTGSVQLALDQTVDAKNCPTADLAFFQAMLRLKDSASAALTAGSANSASSASASSAAAVRREVGHRSGFHISEGSRSAASEDRWRLLMRAVTLLGLNATEFETQLDRVNVGLAHGEAAAWREMVALAGKLAQAVLNNAAWRRHWPPLLALLREQCKPPTTTATKPDAKSAIGGVMIWESVLNRAFEVGEQAIKDGLITAEEVRDESPFLYFGLFGASVLDALQRSLPLKANDAVLLASGSTVTLASCPADLKELMTALVSVKSGLAKANFSPVEWTALRRTVLWSQAEDKPPPCAAVADKTRILNINAVAAGIQSIITQVTQLTTFKQRFGHLLTLLAATSPPAPAPVPIREAAHATSASPNPMKEAIHAAPADFASSPLRAPTAASTVFGNTYVNAVATVTPVARLNPKVSQAVVSPESAAFAPTALMLNKKHPFRRFTVDELRSP